MKRILLLLLFVLPVLVSGQRLKIGKQLEKAPGINYMVLTDINGEQYYTPMSTVLGSINTDQSLGTVTLSGNNLVITERNVLTGAITATYTINLAPYMQTLTAVDNGNGTVTLNMTGDPSPELIDICNIVSTHCNTDLTVSPTGLVTFTDNAGNNFSFNLTSPAAGNDLTYNNGLYFDETVTALSYNPTTHALSYVNEAGATNTITLDVAGLTFNAGTNTLTYTAENGVVTNIVLPADVVTTITNTVTGHKIADYTNELGAVVPINETVIGTVNNPDGSITITKEDGSTFTSVPVAVNGSGSITAVEVSPNVFNLAFKYDCDSVLACIPADIDTIVTDFDIVGNTASITLSSGQVFSATITHPADSTVLTTANTNIVVTETSPNNWELEFVYNCDSITNCLADIQLNQFPIVVSGDTISYVTQITGPKGEVVSDTITIPAQTVTTITGTQAGHTIGTYTNEAGTTVAINETIIDVSLSGNTLTITDEAGTSHNVPLPIDSTVVTSANSNIVVNETSPNAWSLNFTYDCDSITNCLAQIQMIQTPVIMAGDTIGYETEITGPLGDVAIDTIFFPAEVVTNITNQVVGHKIADYTNENGTVQPINETITTMLSVPGGAGAPDTLKYTNEAGITNIVSPIIYGARNNLQLGSPIVERGNVSLGGGQPADFTRNTYNWLGANYQDKWQSAGDANLFDIKANQTVNAANTTNSGAGAVNIGTSGVNGQYKLNVGGAIWLDNGKYSVIVGRNAGLNDVSTENVLIGDFTGQNNTGDGATFVGRLAGQFNTGGTSTIVGYDAGTNNTGNGLSALGAGAARSNTAVNAVFVGNGSGASNTGSQSIGIGKDALRFNSASQSIGIGIFSGMNNTGGSLVSIGNTAAQNNTGNSVVLIGDNAGTLNTGSFSTGIGQGSLNQNSGENAVAYGQHSLGQNSGNDCIGIGFGSLRFNNKSDVIGLGTQTAFTNNASRVIAIGYRAADDFTNPNTPLEGNNVTETILIGSHAGHNQGLASGSEVHSNTIGIGKFALGNSEGSNVIAIGQNAGNTNTQSNRVILGFNELPQFANAAAAAAAMPAASANGVYIYWDLSDNTIKVRP